MSTERSTPTLATLLRLAVAGGRSDRLRIGLTAAGSAGATVGLLTAAAVVFIKADDGPYRLSVLDQPGLRPGVVTCLVLLTIPLFVLVGQCSRVGAPARDRRLAMLRMAGATPSEVRRIGGLETGVAGLLGSGLGLAGFLALRAVFDSTSPTTVTRTTEIIGADGSITIAAEEVAAMARLLPTDVAIPVWAVLLVLAALPLLTTAIAVVALRKVALTPFGVIRSAPRRPPTVVPAVAAAVGTLGLALWTPVATRLVPESAGLGVVGAIALMLFALVAGGLLFGSASIAFALGGVVAPRTSNPALLVAARRMLAAPYTASRATASVLLAVLIGAAVQGTRANFLLGTDPTDRFYADTFTLINVVLVVAVVLSAAGLLVTASEGVVERRRTLAALRAGGMPRRTLAAAILAETLLPLVPVIAAATVAGLMASRGLFGSSVNAFDAVNGTSSTLVAVPIPWLRLMVLAGGAVATSTLVTAGSLALLGPSSDPTELRAAA